MSSDVVLTSALRTNLQSLQQTQRLIDETQLKLATGLAVNSALDNPQNFFASQSLDNRANDLGRLLDGIGQSVRTIEQADNGIASLTSLVEQAESIATSALEAQNSAASGVTLTGNVDVTSFTGVANQSLTFTSTTASGQDNPLTGGAIVLTGGETETDLVNSINAITDGDGAQVFNASITDSGRLEVSTVGSTNFNLEIRDVNGGATAAGSQTLAATLGFGQQTSVIDSAAANSGVAVTARSASAVSSGALFQSDGTTVADRSTLLTDLLRDDSIAAGAAAANVVDLTNSTTNGGTTETFNVEIGINGVARQEIAVSATSTVQSLVDDINNDAVLNTQIQASFDETTGQISLTALSGEVDSIEIAASASDSDTDTDAAIAIDFGFGSGQTQTATASSTVANEQFESTVETIRISGGSGDLAQLQSDYNTVRTQIDTLVSDSDYRGVNLLNGDDLTTTFDEDRTNSLTTESVDFTSSGLGIDEAAFTSRTAIDDSLTQVRDALSEVRNFGQSIANDLAIIQTRRDFTESTINTLEAGADDLTVADQNEEGANLLSLQTRQQLGVTSLSLASQSQQAVLRLF